MKLFSRRWEELSARLSTLLSLLRYALWLCVRFKSPQKCVLLLCLRMLSLKSLLQRRIPGLHQITSIGSTDITDTWEPLEEGLLP